MGSSHAEILEIESRRMVCTSSKPRSTPLSSTPSPPVKVALVAPSLRILGGQAVQADRLLRAWKHDPEIHAWLVPVNPVPPAPLRFALHVKYLRTLVTEAFYLPKLARALLTADVAHVFSASYSSFLLAPLPAILLARALGKPVLLNYRSGEAPDHLRRSAMARWALRRVQRNCSGVVAPENLIQLPHRYIAKRSEDDSSGLEYRPEFGRQLIEVLTRRKI